MTGGTLHSCTSILLTRPQLGPMAGLLGKEHVMSHSPHRRWKGCRACRPHQIRGQGRAARDPWPVLRQIGKRRRIRRGDLGDQQR